ncbi:AraC family transcriptional regulator [Kiritimatiellaeota bacterium B1221]|nr:AraC family transcriptional regulator [Kiritimatiellaeota bacterium B1221]
MIYFDLNPSIRTNFTAAVFYGKSVNPSVIQRVLSDVGMKWPHRVQAVGVQGGPDISILKRYSSREKPGNEWEREPRVLSIHSGLYYFLLPEEGAEVSFGKSARRGEPQRSVSPEHWIHSLQQAVVSLRENELERMGASGSAQLVSKQQEQDAARRLVVMARMHAPDWEEAAADWLRLCMIRYQRMLNIVRRKIMELISSMTRGAEEEDRISFLYADLVLRVYQTHTFSELEEVTFTSLRDVVSLLGGEQGSGGQSEVVAKAIRFLGEHHAEPVSLKELSEAVHVSSSHLARRFRAEMGVSVMTYLHRLRITHAKQLLAESNDTVLSVALDCGFESPEHFHRIFKRITQTTPRRYRMDARVDRI